MKRKSLAILLALCLVFSLMTVMASAAGGEEKEVTYRSLSVYDNNVTFRVVKGGRIEIDSEDLDEEDSFIWSEEENDGVVDILDNQEGKTLVLKGLKVGTATFKLIVDNDETLFDVQVVSDQKGVTISPESLVLALGESRKLDAFYSTGTTATEIKDGFTWGSEDPDIAEVSENSGVVKGLKKGVTTITAHIHQDGRNWSKSCTVMVEDPYEIRYAESENGKIIGAESAARENTVIVTAKPDKNYKVVSIQVVRNDDGFVVATKKTSGKGNQSLNFEMPDCDVTVSAEYAVIDETKKPLKDIEISEETSEVPVGAQFALGVTLNPEDTTDPTDVTWTTSNRTVATVENGIITGAKEGKATITATVGDFSKKCEVAVKEALTSVDVSKDKLTLAAGKSETLTVSYKTSGNDHLIAKWESEDPTVATVDQNGKITGRNIGSTTVKVTVGGKSDTVEVTIKKSEGDFSIMINSGSNGTVRANRTMADKDEFVFLTVEPDEGYELGELKVVDKDNKTVEVESTADNEFSFQMPGADVVVAAAFAKKSSPSTRRFDDVPVGSWYEDAVNYVAEKGYLDGVGNNRFNPSGAVTRGQLCTILYAMEGKPTVTSGSVFPDVQSSRYYYDPVRWAAAKGIVAGYTDGTFKPNVYVSRQQLAAVLYKYTVYKGFDVSVSADITKFADYSSISNYAVSPMRWAVTHKVMSGTNRNTLNPQSAATRAEFAVMLKAYDANVRK